MIAIDSWMPAAVAALERAFGQRLLFVGLQGSYRRGEATEASDLDICVILDRLDAADIAACRALFDALPEGHKAAGFLAGAAQLRAWPALELFAFVRDMDAWHGELAPLLPPVTGADIRLGCRAAVAALYHEAAQSLLLAALWDARTRCDALRSLDKALFRSLQGVVFLRAGVYARERQALLALAHAGEAALLRDAARAARACAGTDADDAEDAACALRQMASAILDWSGALLPTLSGAAEANPRQCRRHGARRGPVPRRALRCRAWRRGEAQRRRAAGRAK